LLQESEPNDKDYGFCNPYAVFNRDEVPIELDKNEGMTIDNTGAAFVWDGVGDGNDKKRYATLNLTIPMAVLPDLSNLPRPHIIFRGEFCDGKDWKKEDERSKWDPRVKVTFQKKAWLDTDTNLLYISQMKDIHDTLTSKGLKSVIFEDNLSSHITAESKTAWAEMLPKSKHVLFPPHTTYCLQPVDRHIGIQYKKAVYRAVRGKMMALLQEGKPMKLSSSEKITHAIGDVHESLSKSDAFKDAYHLTRN